MREPGVSAGLYAQRERWRAALAAGADRVGWKIGLNIPEVQERLGLDAAVIGYLTSATQVEPGGSLNLRDHEELRVEPEVCVEIRREVAPDAGEEEAREAIAAVGPALELVDVGRPPGGLEAILAENVFHRAFAVGHLKPGMPDWPLAVSVHVDGAERVAADASEDPAGAVRVVAGRLESLDERLLPGDLIICGALTEQVPVDPGQRVEARIGDLGAVALAL